MSFFIEVMTKFPFLQCQCLVSLAKFEVHLDLRLFMMSTSSVVISCALSDVSSSDWTSASL